MFKDLKIMHRLGIGFGALLLLMVTLGSVALRQMTQLSEFTGKMYHHPVQVSNIVQRMDSNIIRVHSAMKDVAMAKIPQEIEMALVVMNDLEVEIGHNFDTIEKIFLGEKELVKNARDAFEKWLPIRDEVVRLVIDGQAWRASEVTKGRGAAHMDAITQQMAILNELSQNEAEKFIGNTHHVRHKAFILMYWALGLAISGGLLFTWLFTRSVALPVREIVEVSNAIAKGDLRRQITYHSDDEMGQMAKSLRKMLSGVIGEGQSIKKGIPIVLWTADTNLVMTFINSTAETLAQNLTGLPASAHIGASKVGEVIMDRDDLSTEMAEKSLLYGTQEDRELFFQMNDELKCLRCVTTQLKNLSDNVVGVMGVGIDITERIRAQDKLMESESRLEEAQKIAHLGHWECHLDEQRITWSRELYRILGLRPIATPISRHMVRQMVSKDQFEAMSTVMREALDKGVCSFEQAITRPDGQKRWVVGRGVVARNDDGDPVTVFGTIQDITDQKEAEKKRHQLEIELRQSQKLQAIGTLAGGIAHDFNNILAAILGFSELLRDDSPKGSEATENLDEIIKAALRARDLVKQILNFSRQSDPDLKPVSLPEQVKEAVALLRATLPSSLSIDFSIDKESKLYVMADPTQLHQMVMNLGTNAAHAMKTQGQRLSIALTHTHLPACTLEKNSHLRQGDYQRLTFKDEGCGLSPEEQERIFEPFFTTKAPGEGTGMGLSVVHGIVKTMGGAIEVESQPGHGATFRIWLPTVNHKDAKYKRTDTQALPQGRERILLVDDETSLVTSGHKILEKLGYKVTRSESATEALNLFKIAEKPFDLVITDMTMPGLSGAEFAKKLLEIKEDLPIILLTGYSHDMDEAKARSMGIRRYLLKPLDRSQLAHTVREVLDPEPTTPLKAPS
ncbi:MAG: ATP-binding protein [Desulfobacterales bacterium]|nr:ATP-binding protein [Desulfobacterales bacterium]